MIDYRHVSGFKMQAMIVQELLQAVDTASPVVDPSVALHDDQGNPHSH